MDLTPEAIRRYEAAGAVVKKARQSIRPAIKEGAMSLDIAELVERRIIDEGARPAFPCNIGINDVASHHTPSACDNVVLKTGDVVKIDMGASVDGYVADIAFTVEVGTREHVGLIDAAELALSAGLARIRPGVMVREVGGAIEHEAASRGFHVIKDLLGHSLSRYCLHGGLTIPAYDDGSERKITKGDVLAIEPFLTAGSGAITRMDGGNIYQLIRNDEIYVHGLEEKKLLRHISERFGSFPFAGRWLPDTDMLQELVRAACVKSYPMMVETDGMPVAQAENTVIVEEGGCRIIA